MGVVVREAAVAGMFYPGNAKALAAQVEKFLAEAGSKPEAKGPVPKAIVAPHAGYVYSGPIAATAYTRLLPARETIKRVVLLGPCHRVPVRGLALSGADSFRTPLGDVTVDKEAEAAITGLPQVNVFADTHQFEHSLEVHLPFLQRVLADFTLVPLVVGLAPAKEVAEVLDALWGGPETVIIISSDLSHYLDYDSAQALDGKAKLAIETLDLDGIKDEMACGRMPLRGLMRVARQRGMAVRTLDIRNSGDTAGPRDQVVGYGSWGFFDAESTTAEGDDFAARTRALLRDHGAILLRVAAASIRHGLATGKALPVVTDDFAEALRDPGACFVTLNKNGNLRGCIGSPQAHRPLIKDLAENAFAAAFRDPRFPKLSQEELDALHLHVSVLSPSEPMEVRDQADLLGQLRPGVDGLVIADGSRRALFLPSVWSQLPKPETFLAHLKRKAKMAPDHWSPGFKASRFITEGVEADWRALSHSG